MIPSEDDPKEPNVELDDTTMEDLLIQRALAGSARDEDWSALEALAARDAAVWERLARSIRDGAELTRELASATAGAAAVDIPVIPTIAGPRIPTKAGSPWALRGGWLAAAAVSLFAVLSHLSPPTPADRSAETLGELPKILLEARPRPEAPAPRSSMSAGSSSACW